MHQRTEQADRTARDPPGQASVPDEGTRLISVRQAAERLGLSRSTLYALMTRGQLPYVLIGRSRRIAVTALAKLIQAATHGRVG